MATAVTHQALGGRGGQEIGRKKMVQALFEYSVVRNTFSSLFCMIFRFLERKLFNLSRIKYETRMRALVITGKQFH